MRDKIKLVSTAGTGYFYTTTKNKRTMPNKMEIKKFDPVVRQHGANTFSLAIPLRAETISVLAPS